MFSKQVQDAALELVIQHPFDWERLVREIQWGLHPLGVTEQQRNAVYEIQTVQGWDVWQVWHVAAYAFNRKSGE